MTKPELGTKRICAGCDAKFYDLHKSPIVCPTCNAVFVEPPPAPMRGRRAVEPATVVTAPVAVSMTALKTEPEAELISEDESADTNATAEKADGDKDAESGDVLLADIDED